MRVHLLVLVSTAAIVAGCKESVTGNSSGALNTAASAAGQSDTTRGGGGSRAGGGGPVAVVSLVPDSQIISVGDTGGVSARLFSRAGRELSGRAVTFASSDTSIVRIEGVFGQNVVFRGVGVGTAIITGTSEGVSGQALVFVRSSAPPPPPDSLPPPPDSLPTY